MPDQKKSNNKRRGGRKPTPKAQNPTKMPARRRPRARNNPNNIMRRKSGQPSFTAHCKVSAIERVTQVIVPTTVTPGTLLWTSPVNPRVSPRLAATASQYDSWFGKFTLEVETTGNSFSSDYVILRHVPNGDPARLPTNARNLLALAETCDRPSESYKLQLDSNKTGRVTAIWSSSYNPRKPIIDTDPSECNNGQFIIVADGSPGTSAVNLTIRLRYEVSFFGPISAPTTTNSSQSITATGAITSANLFNANVSVGPGSVTAVGNVLTIPVAGEYIVTYYATGTTLGVPSAVLSAGGSFAVPTFINVSSGTVAMATWNITTTAATTLTLTMTSATITTSYAQFDPHVLTY